jgi:hypothetical protein
MFVISRLEEQTTAIKGLTSSVEQLRVEAAATRALDERVTLLQHSVNAQSKQIVGLEKFKEKASVYMAIATSAAGAFGTIVGAVLTKVIH